VLGVGRPCARYPTQVRRNQRRGDGQAENQNAQLEDIGDGHRPQSADECVPDRDGGRNDDPDLDVDTENNAEGRPERGENGRAPEHLARECRQVEHRAEPIAEALLQRVQHRRELMAPHDRSVEKTAHDQAECVAPRRLHPDEPRGVRALGRAVDVAAAHPCGGHRGSRQPQRQVAPGQHQILGVRHATARGERSEREDQRIEDGERRHRPPVDFRVDHGRPVNTFAGRLAKHGDTKLAQKIQPRPRRSMRGGTICRMRP